MTNQLVLSLFPGIGLLDMAFEEEGFVVVRGPDVLWGGNIRRFHPPAGKFDGVIGGPPCQAFSQLANIVIASGQKPKFGNLIPEFERCVVEAKPRWFLMENVRRAPDAEPIGYGVHSFLLNNRWCFDDSGEAATQNRVRKFNFGNLGQRRLLMVETAVFENPVYEHAACGGTHGPNGLAVIDRLRKNKPHSVKQLREGKRLRADGRKAIGYDCSSKNDFRVLCRKQGMPDEFDLPGFTVAEKCRAIGNGVPLPMGRAIAKSVKEAIELK